MLLAVVTPVAARGIRVNVQAQMEKTMWKQQQ